MVQLSAFVLETFTLTLCCFALATPFYFDIKYFADMFLLLKKFKKY